MDSIQARALVSFLSAIVNNVGAATHTYVVGGAVRNHVMGLPIKDIDLVIDSLAAGKDSAWLAQEIQRQIPIRMNLTTNNYGVAILTAAEPLDGIFMAGDAIEIANARAESYVEGSSSGKGYKPHMVEPCGIMDDLSRREASVNTLLWRLSDVLTFGLDKALVVDLLGTGLAHLKAKELHTPGDANKTFSDDPTRCLRYVKFAVKYGFTIPEYIQAAILRNAPKIKKMPWDAVRKILTDDLIFGPNPSVALGLLQALGLTGPLHDMMIEHPGFAAAIGRDLASSSTVMVAFKVHDIGWPVRTKISFLDQNQREKLFGLPLGDLEGFVQKLNRPDLDQVALIETYTIPPKERGRLVLFAREAMLANPSLANEPEALFQVVEGALQAALQTH